MSIESLKKAFEIIHSFDSSKSFFSGEKSEELVTKAEVALGLTFPPTYREFVKRCGCGGFKDIEIYGIVRESSFQDRIPNAIWLTLKERAEFNMPRSLVIIGSVGDGSSYVIDTSRKNEDGENPVCIWDVDEPIEILNEDFGDFFLEQVTLSASYEDDDEDED